MFCKKQKLKIYIYHMTVKICHLTCTLYTLKGLTQLLPMYINLFIHSLQLLKYMLFDVLDGHAIKKAHYRWKLLDSRFFQAAYFNLKSFLFFHYQEPRSGLPQWKERVCLETTSPPTGDLCPPQKLVCFSLMVHNGDYFATYQYILSHVCFL